MQPALGQCPGRRRTAQQAAESVVAGLICVPDVGRRELAALVGQQHGAPGREPRYDKLGGKRNRLFLVQRAGEQVAGLGEKGDPPAPGPVVLIEPGPLQRQRYLVSNMLDVGRLLGGEPVRLGGNRREHADQAAIGQDRRSQERLRQVCGSSRAISAALSQPVVNGQQHPHARVAGSWPGGMLSQAGRLTWRIKADGSSHSQHAVLVGYQDVRRVCRHGVAGELDRVTEQFLITEQQHIRVNSCRPGKWHGTGLPQAVTFYGGRGCAYRRVCWCSTIGPEAEPDGLGGGPVRYSPQ